MGVQIPLNFDGQKFMKKFGVDYHSFYVNEDGLFCPSLPDLTEEDIADCVTE
jgi:hypothetical protein